MLLPSVLTLHPAAQTARRACTPRVVARVPVYPVRSHVHLNHESVSARLRRLLTAQAVNASEAFDPDDGLEDEDIADLPDDIPAELYPEEDFEGAENPDDVLGSRTLSKNIKQRLQGALLSQQQGFEDESDQLGEDEDEVQDEGDLQETAPDSKYPERPDRSFLIADLFGWAAFYDKAKELEQTFPNVGIYGLQSILDRVQEGEMYCCDAVQAEHVPSMASQAVARGATALILPDIAQDMPEMQYVVPAHVPVFYVESVDDLAVRLAMAFYEAPSRALLMISVVGTHGKTTTSWLIRGILEEMEQVTGMIGSIEVALAEDRLDEDGELWRSREQDTTETRECSAPFMVTPYQGKYTLPPGGLSGLQTQKVLAGMRERGASCCVYEPSPLAVAMRQTAWVDVSVAVHTVLVPPSDSALGGSQEAARQQQADMESLLEPFDKLVDPQAQACVINLDDPSAPLVVEAASAVPQVTYACDNEAAEVFAESVKSDIWESEIIVRTPLGRLQIITPLLGQHNVYNILAAVATGLALKVPLKSIVAGIEAVEIIPGRCEVVDESQDFSVIVDSADTPQALEAMLSSLKGEAKRIITVFGCRGEEDRSIRPLMAEVAHSFSDIVILTNDSPRREPPEHIMQDIVAGLPDSIIKRYSGYVYFPFQDQGHVPLWFEPYLQKAQRTTQRYVMEDRFSAIRAAIGTAAAGDVVVLAGRGHADFMEYDDGEGGIVRGWFDDRLEVRSALSKLAYLNQLTKLSRKSLPWGKALDEMDSLIDPPMPRETQEEEARSKAAAQ